MNGFNILFAAVVWIIFVVIPVGYLIMGALTYSTMTKQKKETFLGGIQAGLGLIMFVIVMIILKLAVDIWGGDLVFGVLFLLVAGSVLILYAAALMLDFFYPQED